MTSRGNQSVSPPAQISQQRHVNAISSNTPPPQQYYQGHPSALPQGAYEFLPQAQGPYTYQAYGSSLSDTRGQPGNGGRGVPTQQNLTQGNNYYQQQPYYITAQHQRNMRHPRPSHQSQQMMFIPQNFTPTNITVPANVYGPNVVPMYPHPSFVPSAPTYPNIVYYQNGSPAWRGPAVPPAAAPAPRPQLQREKKVLSIQDPDTGRDITEELLNSRSHSVGAEEHHEDPSTNNQNQEICQTFSRLVAESLKSPDDSNTSGVSSDSHGADASLPSSTASTPCSEQYQPLLPQQHTQPPQPSSIATPAMMRPPAAGPHALPPTHAGMPQPAPATVAQPHDSQHQILGVNLSMPPPQYPLRQPTQTVYATVSQQHQHPAHHVPRHAQPSQQQPVRPPGPPAVHPPPQQTQNQPPQAQHQPPQAQHHPPQQPQHQPPQQPQHQPPQQPQHQPPQQPQHQPPQQPQHQPPQQPQHQPPQQPQHQPPQQPQHQPPQQPQHQPPQPAVHNQPPSTVIDAVPQPHKVEPGVANKQKPLVDATPQDNIPAKPTGPPPSGTVAPTPVPCPVPLAVEDADIKPSSVKPISSEEASIIDRAGDNGRLEGQGVISQGMKDGRKGRKGKKDFNRKEIGGSDMDAFIDSFENKQENKSNPMKTKAESDSASLLSNKGRETTGTAITAKNVLKRDPKNPWNIKSATDTSVKTDTHNPWSVKGQEPAQAKLPKEDSASSGPGENNITRTNNALDIASEAGSSEAVVHHSEQKAPEVLEAKPVVARAPESTDRPAQRQLPAAASSGVPLSGGPSRDDSPNPQKMAETQKPPVAPAQVESKHKQKKKKKKGRKTPPNQKVKPCSSSNQNSEVPSEVVEVDGKPSQSQSVLEHKPVDKPAGEDVKAPSASIALTQEPSSVTKVSVHTAAPAPPEETEQKVVPLIQKESKSNVEAPPTSSRPIAASLPVATNISAPTKNPNLPQIEQSVKAPLTFSMPVDTDLAIALSYDDSLPVAINISAPTKNSNLPQIEQSGNTAQSGRRAPGLTDRQSSKPVENGIADDVHAEPVPTVSVNVISDSSTVSYPLIDDHESSESFRKQKSDDIKKGQFQGSSASASRQSSEKTMTQAKKDGKEKLQYDRAYLMELRECVTSQTKPEGLPNLEIILDRPVMCAGRGSNTAPLDFTPAFFQQTSLNQRHAPPIGKTNSRNRPRTDLQMPQRIIKGVSLQDSVKLLHQSEKPWKPVIKQVTGEPVVKKSLESEVLFIMNRLTPTNFEKLAEEMKKLDIKTYDDLQQLVKIFFDKVTMETKFVEAYALLCKVMSSLLRVPPPSNSGMKESQATFRVVLLTKCQQEFEADKAIVFEDPEEKRRKIEAEMADSPDKAEKIEYTLYQMKLKRLKFYGNIRFIGELFKLGMLTETIMHDCIFRLLKARDDDSLVSLCNLITTVGKELDTDKARTRMDQYFTQMTKIAEERKSRIKFTLRDAIDLRSNHWIPRKEQAAPKKINEVHKDYQEEQATKQFLQNQPLPPRNDPQPSSRRGSRQRQDENKPTDDGWNTVGSKSLRIDASKMRLSKNVVDENSIQLGPGGGMKQFSMWSRGSYGGAQPSQDNERSGAPANRFSALRGEEDPRHYHRSPSRGDSNSLPNRNTRQGPPAGHGRGKMLARSSQEGERREALASARSIVGGRSQNSSRDNSRNREDRRHTLAPRGSREGENVMTRSDISLQPNNDVFLVPSAPAPVGATAAGYDDVGLKKIHPLSESEMETKAKNIIEEYLSVLDLEEAKTCLRELRGQHYLHVLVTACINEVLEHSNKERNQTGSFFHEMVKGGLLPMEIYLKGLADVLQYAEDIVIDIPMIWTYLGQIIVPMLLGGSLPWSSLQAVLKPTLDGRGAAKLLAEILQITKDIVGEEEVTLMWQTSDLCWTAFMPAEEVDRFVKDKKLEFTSNVASPVARVPMYGQMGLLKLTEDIEKIVQEKGKSAEIFAYIDAKVPVEKRDKLFVRSIVTAIVNASIPTDTMKLNEATVKAYKDVLQQYIANKPELEMQALYAIQALMHKLEHPSGVIATIFDVLYDEDVISDDSMKLWETTSDPLEAEGRGACSMQLTQFFAWLRNEELEAS